MRDSSPDLLTERMQAIEEELERLQNDWAQVEGELVRRTVEVQRLAAPERLRLKRSQPSAKQGGPTKEDLDALVLDWLWDEHTEVMEAHLEAEAKATAYRVTFKCAEAALSSKQSRLRADVKLAVETRR